MNVLQQEFRPEGAEAPPRRPRALVVVNEYGEFFELLRAAEILEKRLGLDCTFLFARDDFSGGYGELDYHTSLAAEGGFHSVSLNWESIEDLRWRVRFGDLAEAGYLPESIWRPRRQPPRTARRAVGPLLIPVAVIMPLVTLALIPLALLAGMLAGLRRLGLHRSRTVRRLSGWRAVMLPATVRHYRRWRKYARAIGKAVEPDILIFGQNYAGAFNEMLMAQHRDTPAVILPFAMGTAKEISEALLTMPDCHLPRGPLGYVVKWLYPQWVNRYRGRSLVRLPVEHIFALDMARVYNPHPWTPNAGADILCCQSAQSLDYYNKAGIPQTGMRLTGALWNDALARTLENRERDQKSLKDLLFEKRLLETEGADLTADDNDAGGNADARGAYKHNLNRRNSLHIPEFDLKFLTDRSFLEALRELRKLRIRNKAARSDLELLAKLTPELRSQMEDYRVRRGNLVIVSWPTNQYPRKACGFKDYQEFHTFMLDSFGRLAEFRDVYVVVSLHPTLRTALDRDEFSKRSIHVVDWPLTTFIHCADLFVANVSSTIFWAVQCGIPVLNFDAYNYGYTEFAEAGCVTVTSPRAFQQKLDELVTSPAAYEAVRERIVARRDYWTRPQGGAEAAISEVIAEMLGSPELMLRTKTVEGQRVGAQ